jgi:hypothetical protein
MGEPVDPSEMLRYLTELGQWRTRRREELDSLDHAALQAAEPDAMTADVMLSMALWQAISTRYDELERVWDSGRVSRLGLLKLASMVWGRLEATPGMAATASLAVSVPEACRLSDALTGQLRQRLSLDPVGLDLAAHLRSLRATLERIRDLVPEEPAGPARDAAAQRLLRLDRRLEELSHRAQRGADVGGLVGPLESEAAVAERDLIVGAATRRDDDRDLRLAYDLRERLRVRAVQVAEVADRCVALVTPAPRFAVPQVQALGAVPSQAADVDTYLARLRDVERALTVAEQAYAAPLAEREELEERLDAYRAKAFRTGRASDEEVAAMYDQARRLVTATPADLPRVRLAVAAYQTLLGALPSPSAPGATA